MSLVELFAGMDFEYTRVLILESKALIDMETVIDGIVARQGFQSVHCVVAAVNPGL